MQPSRLFFSVALLLAPVALFGTTWLYLYPIFHGCTFPTPPSSPTLAPFRLLALGDPQLEGDSSLPNPNAPVFPSLEYFVTDIQYAKTWRTRYQVLDRAFDGVIYDLRRWLEGKRKAIDLWGNDWYLAHIVRSVRWWSEPTHVAVLGDLLGSQWITDGEFEKRAGRYWNVVMRGLEKVPDHVYGKIEEAAVPDKEAEAEKEEQEGEEKDYTELGDASAEDLQIQGEEENDEGKTEEHVEEAQDSETNEQEKEEEVKPLRTPSWGGTTEVLGANKSWANRVINIAGNHDVGYAGDLDVSRVARFEKAFGSVNWDIWFTLPQDHNTSDDATPESNTPPALRIVILNSMNIDTPAWSYELQTETYSFMNHIITTSRAVEDKTHATILLTHIPLEKQPGICVDSPYFNFFDEGQGLREQNMLSDHSSKTVLEGVFGMSNNRWAAGGGMGRRGIVLNGHDHEGCDIVHFIRQEGADDDCSVEHVKREEAYWPTPTFTPTSEPPSYPPALETSPANLLLADKQTSPAPPPPPPPAPPEPAPTGWLAHRFPNRPYSIIHDPLTNTSSCTSIDASPHVREITLRSMMGDFSGHAGFLSGWFDSSLGDNGEWVFEFNSCGVGVQHWWWAVHSIDFSLVVMILVGGGCWLVEKYNGITKETLRSTVEQPDGMGKKTNGKTT